MNSRYYLILLILVLLGAGGYFTYERYFRTPRQQACTMEALICPDGSSVGRSGPNCTFAPCPQVGPDVTTDWLVATSTPGFTYRYPRGLDLKYVELEDWPPVLGVEDVIFSCVLPKNIAGRLFCVRRTAQGAGGEYTQYSYSFALEEHTATLIETVREARCDNFSVGTAIECKQEQRDFSLDELMADVAGTVAPK